METCTWASGVKARSTARGNMNSQTQTCTKGTGCLVNVMEKVSTDGTMVRHITETGAATG